MASPPLSLNRRSTTTLLPAILRLAWWRLKQMWRVLLVTWLGMVSMVVLICSIPLFTQVANTAGLRSTLTAVPPSQQRIAVSFSSLHPTTNQLLQAHQQINQIVQNNLGPYTNGDAHFSVAVPPLTIQRSSSPSTTAQTENLLSITGYDLDKVGSELTVLQGRLPAPFSTQIEVALTQMEARSLKVGIGSVLTATFPDSIGQITWTLHVVGIIGTKQNWEYDNPFQPQTIVVSSHDSTGASQTMSLYPILASSATLLPRISSMQVNLTVRQLFGKGAFTKGVSPFFVLNWIYPFDASRIDANQAGVLGQAASNTSSQLHNALAQIQDAALFQQDPQGAVFALLSQYTLQTTVSAIPIAAFLTLILALVLFLVSTMSVALVERQTPAIATLRSRGATRRHIFGAFVAQGLGLGLLALFLGPFLALLLVDFLAHLLLSVSAQTSLNVLTNNPLSEVLSVGWFALAAVTCAMLAVILAVRHATRLDVLAFRRESARLTRQPFWRRLNLDIIGALLLCAGYVGYLYTSQPALSAQLGNGLLVLRGALALLAPFLVSAVCFTLFLRLFPLFLRLSTRLVSRTNKAPAMLAIAQMERAPRPAARMILLLALVISTTIFILSYTATQQQRTVDTANYAVGADFSGPSSPNQQHLTLAQQTAAYLHTPGVLSATPGYMAGFPAQGLQANLTIFAPDASTYASSALWTAQYSDQALPSLMSLLLTHRNDAFNNDTLPVIIDDALAKNNNLAVGSTFLVPTVDGYTMHALVVGQIHTLPGVYDTGVSGNRVAVLCDYQSYAAVYAKNSGNALDPTTVWLRTRGDASSLTSVRHAYPQLQDRRALIDANEANPLYVNVTGVLDLSIVTALLLAVIGVLFFSWLNAAGRLTNFAVLRALGMAPRQIAMVLLWEQGSIYVAALVLGLLPGLFLLTFIGPALVFGDAVISFSANLPLYTLPVQLSAPVWLIAALLGALILICGIALAFMVRLVARPSLGQVLRLNED